MNYRAKLAAIAAIVVMLLTVLAPSASANDAVAPEWELETVESLHFESNNRYVFFYPAPPPSCTIDGLATSFNCPNVIWTCPNGITAGALLRLERDVPYDYQVAGYESRESMCLLPDAKPVPAATPTPTPTPTAVGVPVNQPTPDLAFTGSETSLAYVGGGLLAAGFAVLGMGRRSKRT